MALQLYSRLVQPLRIAAVRSMSSVGDYGSGSGKGGGSGGTIRDAGGSFGKMEAAHEEEYFRKVRQEQLKEFKKHVKEQQDFHADEIRKHQEAISRHKQRIEELERKHDSDSD